MFRFKSLIALLLVSSVLGGCTLNKEMTDSIRTSKVEATAGIATLCSTTSCGR